MVPFAIEITLLLLLAFVLGGFLGAGARQILAARGPRASVSAADAVAFDPQDRAVTDADAIKPALAAPAAETVVPRSSAHSAAETPARSDDLSRISGLGAPTAARLRRLGITRFEQIATWGRGHIAWIDRHLGLGGEIERGDWVGQAQRLAAEGAATAPATGA